MNSINNTSSNVQFKGLAPKKLRKIYTSAQKALKVTNRYENTTDRVASILHINSEKIADFSKTTNTKQKQLMNACADKYNKNNYRSANPEDSTTVLKMISSIKEPKVEHFDILRDVDTSFANLDKAFKLTNNSKKGLNFIYDSFADLAPKKTLTDTNPLPIKLLESKNAKTYINNYTDYRSYLILNKKDENVVKNLDKMVESKSFDKNVFDKKLKAKNLENIFYPTKNLNTDFIEKNYSKEGNSILKSLVEFKNITSETMKAGTDKDLATIYKTTTKENKDIRLNLIKFFNSKKLEKVDFTTQRNIRIQEYGKLFKKIDENKDSKKLVNKILKYDADINSPKELNSILDNHNPKKINIFFDNFKNIYHQTSGNKDQHKIIEKELTNPFFETETKKSSRLLEERYGYSKKESFASKFEKIISNKFNILKDKVTSNSSVETKIKTPIVKTPTTTPNAKKLVVVNDVDNIISKKLGKKTFEEQKRDYNVKATKMRLNLLPEIFNSIKETRATSRANGQIKNATSNKDALTLYEMINGKNKKLVNYMLKKRNTDGTRTFEVKDIISTIDNTNNKIINKTKNQKFDRSAKAKLSKESFDNLYTETVNNYGQLQRSKK